MTEDIETTVSGPARREPPLVGQTITLIESSLPTHQAASQTILERILPQYGKRGAHRGHRHSGVGKELLHSKPWVMMLVERGLQVRSWRSIPAAAGAAAASSPIKTRINGLPQTTGLYSASPFRGTLGGLPERPGKTILGVRPPVLT